MSHSTFRPRGGDIRTVGVGVTATIPVPSSAHKAIISCSLRMGRVLIDGNAEAPTPTATNYGYVLPDVPMLLNLTQGGDLNIHVSSTVAANDIHVTFGN